jgi:hypothetical protein
MAKRPKTGGRKAGTPNKVTGEVKLLARTHTAACVSELARLAVGAVSEQARVAAIKELLDRAWGKSMQPTQIGNAEGESFKTDGAFRIQFVAADPAPLQITHSLPKAVV